jgi:hypothetical protein
MKIQLEFSGTSSNAMECVEELRLAVKATGWQPSWIMLAMILRELEVLDDEDWPSDVADELLAMIIEKFADMERNSLSA